jgi:hypothetical protein
MVHDPRSPCEESQEAVHLVVLVEMLQETLVDGAQVDDKKSRSLAAITAHHCGPRSTPCYRPPSQLAFKPLMPVQAAFLTAG